MDDANRVLAELDCPRCGERRPMEVRFRYGPAGHPPLELGGRIEWRPGAQVLDGPSSEPDLTIAGLASCPDCAALAARFARDQWKTLKRVCDGEGDALPRGRKGRADRVDPILAFLDYGFSLREARELGGETIGRPGRYIERLAELVLGFPPAMFDWWSAVVRIERDRVTAVRLLPLAVQDAIRVFPVSLHFGLLSPAVPVLLDLAERRGADDVAITSTKLAIRHEVVGWWQELASEPDGRLEFANKVRALLAASPWADTGLGALAALDRFSTVGEIEESLAALSGGLPESVAGEDPLAALIRWSRVTTSENETENSAENKAFS